MDTVCKQASTGSNKGSTGMLKTTSELVESLNQLKTATYGSPTSANRSFALADRVLELIFQLGHKKIPISDKEKAIIGPLLEDSLKYIQINIKRVTTEYRSRLDTEILQKRSALQFLKDNFNDFPTRTTGLSLSDVLSLAKMDDFIGVFDELINHYRGRSDPDDPDSDREDANDLPPSHTWWQ